jgi:acyl-CoA thioester hydrolase
MSDRARARSLRSADFPKLVAIPSRYSDVDPLLHLNNVAVAGIFAEARAIVMREVFAERPRPPELKFMVGQVAIGYLGEARYPLVCEVGCGIVEVTDKVVRFGQALFQEERCLSVAEAVLVSVREGRSSAMDEPVRQAFAPYLLVDGLLPRQLM